MPSPYDVLGVDSEADDGAVEAAYRERLKETHPDHGGDPAAFRAVRAAYAELTDGAESSSLTDEVVDVEVAPTTVTYLDYDVMVERGWTLDDPGLFDRAQREDLPESAHGHFEVHPTESLLEAAEHAGFDWPYACRGGACANCAVAVLEGALEMPVNHILPPELVDRDIQLSCVGSPATDELRVVFNVKHLPELEELRLPPYRFELARGD